MERVATDPDYYNDGFKISQAWPLVDTAHHVGSRGSSIADLTRCVLQGIKVGNLIFFSGQVGITNEDGNLVPGGMMAQGEQAFKNLERALAAGGASMASVVEVTMFVTNMDTGLEATNT
jgi:enamine deaminase RidA (YjgF/YER057c/UK114 family)